MAASSARLPTIAGSAQIVQRVDDPGDALEPIALMEQALRRAAEDAGAPKLVESLDGIFVPQGLWKYGNPGSLLGERLGSPNAHTRLGKVSGHIVQILLNQACQEIAAGRADVIAIVGGESENSKRRLTKMDRPLHWDDEIPGKPDIGPDPMAYTATPDEIAAGVLSAPATFSICDVSRRRALGETPLQHRHRISSLWSKMSGVGAKNPYAWIQRELSAEEIRDPADGNRMVNYPYTKLMTSNISVDQSAALIVCSTEAADKFGVPKEKRVFLQASTEMSHSVLLSERDVLHRHPGQVLAAERILERTSKSPSDLDHVDLYACFPFAVQVGAEALGMDLDPVPSLTGGMTFFGGPFGNYVLHSKASMIERLRAHPGTTGAIGSVGGSFQHFSFGFYSTEPCEAGFPMIEDVSDEFAAMPRRDYVAEGFEGSATVESYSVIVMHNGPFQASFAAIDDDGRRIWGRSHDEDLMQSLLADEDPIGRRGQWKDGLVVLD